MPIKQRKTGSHAKLKIPFLINVAQFARMCGSSHHPLLISVQGTNIVRLLVAMQTVITNYKKCCPQEYIYSICTYNGLV